MGRVLFRGGGSISEIPVPFRGCIGAFVGERHDHRCRTSFNPRCLELCDGFRVATVGRIFLNDDPFSGITFHGIVIIAPRFVLRPGRVGAGLWDEL